MAENSSTVSRNPIATRPVHATKHYHNNLLKAAGVELPDLTSDPILAQIIEEASGKLPKKTRVVPALWIWVGVIVGERSSSYELVSVPSVEDFADRMRDQKAEVYVHYYSGTKADVTVFQYSPTGASRFTQTIELRRQLVTPYTGRLEAENYKVERSMLEWRSDLLNRALDKYQANRPKRPVTTRTPRVVETPPVLEPEAAVAVA